MLFHSAHFSAKICGRSHRTFPQLVHIVKCFHLLGLAIYSLIHSHLTAFPYSRDSMYHKGNHLFQVDDSFIDVRNVTVTNLYNSSLIYHDGTICPGGLSHLKMGCRR